MGSAASQQWRSREGTRGTPGERPGRIIIQLPAFSADSSRLPSSEGPISSSVPHPKFAGPQIGLWRISCGLDLNRLAVAFAVGVVHGGEQVGRPRQLELDDGQCEAGMTLEGAGEDQIAQRQRRSFLGAGRSRFCYDQRGWERP